ncbi:MAG TPA: response regulator [Rhizomicrobium sp.]|jgi:CheY-like chemotaxis protein|nr:response regulator [Rhizomicrobium sp.]
MATGPKAFETLKILIIEDKEHMRALLRRLLNHIGVRITHEAPDGTAALDMLPTLECDLILSDLSMAPMDGLEFARKVRGASNPRAAAIPIIMISGYTERAKIEAARDAGVNEFLAKPVTPQNLISRITEIMERPRAFVKTESYAGPDRRRRQTGNYVGPGRRANDPPGTKGFLEPPKQIEVIEKV